jgi:hypothetical protein
MRERRQVRFDPMHYRASALYAGNDGRMRSPVEAVQCSCG